MNYFCTYIAQNLLFQKKEEANEIQCSQNNYFLFNTSENIYILRYLFPKWCFYFEVQRNPSSLLLYSLPYSDALVLEHWSALHLTWLLNMCSRGTLLACCNSTNFFYSYLSYTPNIAWFWEHLLWCIHIADPYHN